MEGVSIMLGSGTGLAIVLAAGEGTRMRSSKPKVLHEIARRSMLGHVLARVVEAGFARVAVVVGPGRDDVAAESLRHAPGGRIFVQEQRLGTAHAALAAREALGEEAGDAIVLFADNPLVTVGTLQRMREAVAGGAALVALGFQARDPAGYGRFIVEGGELAAIREHKDASDEEREIRFCNAGLMAFGQGRALELLEAVRPVNSQGEFYLTDCVGLARERGWRVGALGALEDEVMGVNDRAQLSRAEALMQHALREAAMREGATLIDPASVTLCHDTRLGRDVVVEPHVVFGPGVEVGEGALVRAFSHVEGARIAVGAQVGPYARLRPGASIGAGARVGNFVEVKNADIGEGAKINHLSYVGDASVGRGANVGAGTITCNYDGFDKHRTLIGAGAFIGSNSALVAPVTVGEGAYVGSGSVVTQDVPAGALAVGRGRQVNVEGWAGSHAAKREAKGGGAGEGGAG